MKTFPLRLALIAFIALAAVASPAQAKERAAAPVAAQDSPASPPILPDAKMTPGDTLEVTLADIQEKGYSAKVRNVPVSVKREVYNAYGITHWEKGEYEIDHLVSLSLGGSNSKKNLWPQSYQTNPWNARTKDQLEVKLLKLVRDGKVDLHEAQQAMAKDWIAAYKKYVSPTPIVSKPRGKTKSKDPADLANAEKDEDPDTETAPAAPTKAVKTTPPLAVDPSAPPSVPPGGVADEHAGQVWVNTKSGVIWKPGSRYFGKTKEGKYMTPEEAAKAGYHEAK